jgi:branched-chain amino acid aminotransferase
MLVHTRTVPGEDRLDAAATPEAAHPGFEARGLAYFDGRIVPMERATVSIATHAFNYGTGCFEGIRAYWNAERGELYALKLTEHFERLRSNAAVLRIGLPLDPDGMAAMALELLRMNGYRQDVYLRPVAYKASPVIRVGLLGLTDGFCCFTTPMADYHDTRHGLAVTVSAWRRNGDNSVPPRVKATGGYLNAALAVADAQAAGYDEAILLTADGHVSEASAANLFLVSHGTLVTPDPASDILPGITRTAIMDLATAASIRCIERPVCRTELYAADEMFLCGTGVQVAPVSSVDGRPVGGGRVGPVTTLLRDRYLAAVRGELDEYRPWLTPVYG